MDTNKLLLQETLKMIFNFVTYKVNSDGIESYNSTKLWKKSFMEAMQNERVFVKLVDKYPEIMEDNVMYVRKDGRTVWYKENNHK